MDFSKLLVKIIYIREELCLRNIFLLEDYKKAEALAEHMRKLIKEKAEKDRRIAEIERQRQLVAKVIARAKFESAKFRKGITLAFSGIAIIALVAYKLFKTEKIMVSKTLSVFR